MLKNCTMMLVTNVHVSKTGGSRKLFWEGHIGLESPKTTKWDAEGVEEMSGQEVYPLPSRLGERRISSPSGVWGVAPAANGFGHYTHNFVRFHACFNVFWNITGKANKTDPIRPPLPASGLEGACAPCLDPPMLKNMPLNEHRVPMLWFTYQ